LGGTITRADLGLAPTPTQSSPDIISLSGSEPGAVAPPGGRPLIASSAPAFSWIGLVLALILVRVVYEFGKRH
jgi:hypothetical protein